jgi:hypothetical protein
MNCMPSASLAARPYRRDPRNEECGGFAILLMLEQCLWRRVISVMLLDEPARRPIRLEATSQT